ncbi:hypothetical protein ABT173_45655 [Streptomyces sp. NPDC001795]|uniref:hypothetical protein n=1 Tax=Streptomyces sp. NPDC001795 TaxID=3154525 RepID=UPI0033222ED7
MMYIFLTTGDTVPEEMPRILAGAFGVQVVETDVSDSSELESRNWDAMVTCEYEHLAGDLRWSLNIYAAEEVEQQPSEEHLARHLAQQLGRPVFFTWNGGLPWIRRVALPEGGLTLARVAEPDDEKTGFSVEAAEAPISGIPPVPVTHFPEVVRAFEIPTPATDAVVPREASEEQNKVRGLLVNWERLCVRMRSNWPPSGWYSAALYQEDLEYRDELETFLKGLPDHDQRQRVGEVLGELDAHYRELTIADEGRALAAALGQEAADLAGRSWYWHRCPQPLPWVEGRDAVAR